MQPNRTGQLTVTLGTPNRSVSTFAIGKIASGSAGAELDIELLSNV
jgi:hypothetical protein